jgi:two-component system, NarL family, sensor histidine kinase DevS
MPSARGRLRRYGWCRSPTLRQVSEGPGDLPDAVFTASPDAVIVVDEEGRIRMASGAVTTLFGYQPEEIVDQAVELLVPDRVKSVHRGHRAKFAEEQTARPMGAGLELSGRRRDGSVFPVDVSLAPLMVGGGGWTAAFVRDATDRRRTEYLMRSINEVTRQVLAGEDTSAVLAQVAERARELVDASAAWVVVPNESDRALLRVAAAAGRGSDLLLGAALDAQTSLSAQAMETSHPLLILNMSAEPLVIGPAREAGFGPGAYLPMLTQDGPIGALVVARETGFDGFVQAEVDAVEVFAAATAVGTALGAARNTLEDLHIVSEHERIARDLHDTVIQRLFALGMGLQGAQRLADDQVSERIRLAVEAIDEVIREIRETIFDLNRPPAAGLDIRQQVRAVVTDIGIQLGLHPRLSFRGPVEARTSDETLTHLLAVLREAITNAARHARASKVDVVLMATPDTITLSVADDGIGMPDGPSAGHGLTNMADRAARLGGELIITQRRPTGTLLQWKTPARPSE